MEKIKIGFVVNNLVIGGVSSVLIHLCNGLDQSKYELHLIVLSNDLEMEKLIPLKAHIKKHTFNYQFLESFSLFSYLKAAFNSEATKTRSTTILAKIKNLELDILHFHTLPRQLIIGQLALKQEPRLKLVYTDHSVRLAKGEYNWYQHLLLKIAYKKYYKNYSVIVVSKAVDDCVKSNFKSHKNQKIELLENSIPISSYNRSTPITAIQSNQFIYISRINLQKGHDTLINAWRKINLPNKGKLLIVGPDEANEKFHKMADGDSTIVFTGGVNDVKTLLNDSNIGIFPSQKEGLPLSLLEMMAYQLPVIVSDISELTSIISDHNDGLHFKLNDIDDLQSKIEFAIKNKNKMQKMGLNARQKSRTYLQNK